MKTIYRTIIFLFVLSFAAGCEIEEPLKDSSKYISFVGGLISAFELFEFSAHIQVVIEAAE